MRLLRLRPMDALSGFERREQTFLGKTKSVYHRGEGPPVLVMAEVPGLTPPVMAFARRVVERGMSVAVPDMFLRELLGARATMH